MGPYNTLRFETGAIPDALLREHSLKRGVRGELKVMSGDLLFVDEHGATTHLSAGDTMQVNPEAKHHLEDAEGAAIEIALFRVTPSE